MRVPVTGAIAMAAAAAISAWTPAAAREPAPDAIAPPAKASPAPAVVSALRDRGARLTALGERGGLAGWLVELAEGESYTLYVAPDGHAVAGLMYAPDGALVTREQIAGARGASGSPDRVRPAPGRDGAIGPRSGSTRIAQADGSGGYPGVPESVLREIVAGKPAPSGLFARSAALFGFTLGHRGRQAVIFADPDCPWSTRAVDELGRLALGGSFRLRVVPVGVLGAASARKAIRIASSPDPALAWFGRDVSPEHRAGSQWVEENNAVYEQWGADAVPVIAWPGPGGHVYRVGSIGRPDIWAAEIFGR